MNTHDELISTIAKLTAPGKGILAADESTPTITKRFKAVGIESTDETRRQYRNLLFTTPEANQYLAGIILFEETRGQKGDDGTLLPISSPTGHRAGHQGGQGHCRPARRRRRFDHAGIGRLGDRLAAYKGKGARFAKWREVYAVPTAIQHASASRPTPRCSRATRRSARRTASCRSSSPKCLIDGAPYDRALPRSLRSRAARRLRCALPAKVLLEAHGAEAEHGAARQGEPAEGVARGRRPRDARGAEAHGAGGGADDQLPCRRPIARRSHREPQRNERDGRTRHGCCRSPTRGHCRMTR